MEKSIRNPEYSVLIVGFHSLRFLEEGFASLLAAGGPAHEILFLDNASPEPEADWIEAHLSDSRIRVFRSPGNLLFAGGMNFLVARARAPFVILLNPDARVAPDWLEVLETSREAWGFEACQLDLREAARPEIHETQGVSLDRLGFISHVSRPTATQPFRIFSGRGAGVLFARKPFLELGGLDEDMGMYFEETDFFWRWNLSGREVWFVPGAKVFHVRGGSTTVGGFDWRAFRFTRNRIGSLVKNLEAANLVIYLPLHFGIYLARFPLLVLAGRGRRAVAEAAAIAAALVRMPLFFAKRETIARLRKVRDAELIEQGLLVSPSKPRARLLRALGRYSD